MNLFYAPDILTCPELPEDEAAHALRVLRMTMGDTLTVTDGRGTLFQARLSAISGRHCTVSITGAQPQPPLWRGHLHLAIAPTKNMDRMEWLIEKATEIGIDEITFLCCRYSERRVVKTDRIRRVAVAAMKQSLKARLPQVNEMTDFDPFITQPHGGQCFIAHCHPGPKPHLLASLDADRDAVVLIGPEGDFSPEEVAQAVAHGYQPVSLGPSRLRTETAALVACHLMALTHQKA